MTQTKDGERREKKIKDLPIDTSRFYKKQRERLLDAIFSPVIEDFELKDIRYIVMYDKDLNIICKQFRKSDKDEWIEIRKGNINNEI